MEDKSNFQSETLYNNNLVYKLPSASSVTIARTLKRGLFQNRTYTAGQTCTIQVNSGVDFVDTMNSALYMKVKTELPAGATGDYAVSFGNGSAMNLISRVRIYHRSGTCYTNSTLVNLYRCVEDHGKETSEWFSTVGKAMGYNMTGGFFTNIVANQNEAEFVIPLYKLHPFLESLNAGQMMPPQMMSGLRIEIDLSSANEAFTWAYNGESANNPCDYSITDMYLTLMSATLTDDANSTLNIVAQKQTLEWVYNDVFTSVTSTPSTTDTVNLDINRSVGYATHVTTSIRESRSVSSQEFDAFAIPYKSGSYWYLLGSLQFPINKIDKQSLAYHNFLVCFDKYKTSTPGIVTPESFLLLNGAYVASLERDTSLALSSSIVNASRALRLELTLDEPLDFQSLATCFLTYTSSARTSLLSSRVDV